MEAKELREKSVEELKALEADLATEAFKLRMQLGNQQLDRNHMVKVVRRDIARIKTILTQKQKGENERSTKNYSRS